MKINKTEKILIYVIAGLVLLFLVERLLFSGLRGKAGQLSQQIKVEEAEIRAGLDIQKRKDKIASECKDLKPYLDSVEGISEREISAKFLKEVEKIAQSAGTSIVGLSPQDETQETAEYIKYNAEFRAEGNLSQVFNFVHKVQSDSLLIKIDKISLSTKDEEARTIKIEAILSLVIPK